MTLLSNYARDTTVPNGTCYSITGRASPFNDYTYVPCNLTAIENGQHSACCASGDTCLTNGLCKFNPRTPAPNFNTYWRIGCTDPTYQDPACPKQCKNKENVERHVHIVFECPGDGQWCCGTGANTDYANTMTVNTTCCNIPDLAFKDEAREPYTTAIKDWKSQIDMQTIAAFAESTATDASLTRSTSVAAHSTGLPISDTTSIGAPTSEPATTSPSSSSSTNTVALGVGLGLGIPLLICLLLGLAFILYRSKRARNPTHERLGQQESDNARHTFPQPFLVEKSGREVPAELDADRGKFEMWTPVRDGTIHELDRPDSWRTGDDGKRVDFRDSDVYR